jgi:hypothetical protein
VLRKLSHLVLILAVVMATGTHWLLLQSVAWTTMLADNLHSTSFAAAVERTFDGNHPCCLCRQIAREKQNEKKTNLRVEWKKVEFSYLPSIFTFKAPAFFWEISAVDEPVFSLSPTPPVPPPRLSA